MTLSALIRKSESVKVATATLATLATLRGDSAATVATVATVNVANPAEAKSDALPRRAWLLHFAEREPLEVIFCPDQTHAEVLALYPAALAAEPEPGDAWPPDDRVTCEQCARLATVRGRDGFRHCRAIARRYCPAPVVRRRCESFTPGGTSNSRSFAP